MHLLLDTHVVIWSAVEPLRVPERVRRLIEAASRRYVSVVSHLEVAFKHRKSPEAFAFTLNHLRSASSSLKSLELPLSGTHILKLAEIPVLHKDPFDHLLMAQAIAEGLTFVTADEEIGAYRLPGLNLEKWSVASAD